MVDVSGCTGLQIIKGSSHDFKKLDTLIARDCPSLNIARLAERCESEGVKLVV